MDSMDQPSNQLCDRGGFRVRAAGHLPRLILITKTYSKDDIFLANEASAALSHLALKCTRVSDRKYVIFIQEYIFLYSYLLDYVPSC